MKLEKSIDALSMDDSFDFGQLQKFKKISFSNGEKKGVKVSPFTQFVASHETTNLSPKYH
jgi:hypothetical protein